MKLKCTIYWKFPRRLAHSPLEWKGVLGRFVLSLTVEEGRPVPGCVPCSPSTSGTTSPQMEQYLSCSLGRGEGCCWRPPPTSGSCLRDRRWAELGVGSWLLGFKKALPSQWKAHLDGFTNCSSAPANIKRSSPHWDSRYSARLSVTFPAFRLSG